MDKKILEKINRFTRRELSEDEVYVFSVILCDNDVDRDGEKFSDGALDSLREKFIGKTGISDHNASSANQTARIFDTELVTDTGRRNKLDEPYKYLKASAYMIRTEDNKSLIDEIDGGIKKEVSVSCSADKRTCSICGTDRSQGGCAHIKGKTYGGKLCHTVLDGITDAYEWSFVAVPAQVNAGVTKKYTETDIRSEAVSSDIRAANDELRRDIRKLAFFSGGRTAADTMSAAIADMETSKLIALKKSLERKGGGIEVQLVPEKPEPSADEFSMR